MVVSEIVSLIGSKDREVLSRWGQSIVEIRREEEGEDGRRLVIGGSGILVLTFKRLCVLTNAHVIPDRQSARGSSVSFSLLISDAPNTIQLRPELFFLSSPPPRPSSCSCGEDSCSCRQSGKCSLGSLDYSLIAAEGEGLAFRQPLLIPRGWTCIPKDHRILLLHRTRQGGLRCAHEELVEHDQYNLLTVAATPSGSSGSPIFSSLGELIGIHRAGGNSPL